MDVVLYFHQNVLLQIVEDVEFLVVQGVVMTQVELHGLELAGPIVAVGLDVHQLEVAGSDIVWHQNQGVAVKDAGEVLEWLPIPFDV